MSHFSPKVGNVGQGGEGCNPRQRSGFLTFLTFLTFFPPAYTRAQARTPAHIRACAHDLIYVRKVRKVRNPGVFIGLQPSAPFEKVGKVRNLS
jgi:hypothetical protein